jgi:2',3'-cyclic-nucleotide 2'-phosphodiesterase (5'-nucleotidase family)
MISHITLKVKSHKVTESYGEVINTLENCNSTSSEIDAVYDGYKPEIDRIKNTIIGKTSVALSKPELGAIASKSIIYYINNHQDEFNYKVDYAEVNSGGTRNTIEAGNVTYGMIYQVFPFDNNIVEADLDEAGLAAYKSYDGNYSYTLNEPKVDTDGLYHIGTINYVSEIYDGKGVNKSRTYSPTLLRDAIVEAISKNYIDEIKPIVD